MQVSEFEHFRDLLLDRRQSLNEWLNSGGHIDKDDQEKVRQLLAQIKDSLGRIEDESFGTCVKCQGSVELHRLEVQPVTQICIDCLAANEKAELEEDLFLASKIHRALLPQSIPKIKGFEIAAGSRAASNIGGDYYDFIQGGDDTTFRVVIADVMGHGLPAGLLMSNLQGALRILSADVDSPGALITRLNKWLCRNVPVTKFISLICLNLELKDNRESKVTYVNAGHCPPIISRKDGSIERIDSTGSVLGVHEGFHFEENNITLKSGDSLTLFTDGITEAMNSKDEFFSEDRLINFIRSCQTKHFNNIIDDLMDAVSNFSGSPSSIDDRTAIILLKK